MTGFEEDPGFEGAGEAPAPGEVGALALEVNVDDGAPTRGESGGDVMRCWGTAGKA